MIAAHSNMMIMAASSPWMILRMNRSFAALGDGSFSALNALRQDRNSNVGTIDKQSNGDKYGKLRHECVAMKIIICALLEEKYAQQTDNKQDRGRRSKHCIGE